MALVEGGEGVLGRLTTDSWEINWPERSREMYLVDQGPSELDTP